ncbi:hypothetical protein [Pseudonocardia dioxanivorans]|uniref:hypothetical protein n=1 Tax=Pseudonocardia dioxanivorans TaxID=240495 RepID=UPI0002DC97A2|nr:hypothetical protein [Pseudonocardia dioxanivorans]
MTVTLTVEVDGHRMTFEAHGKAMGPRYHGTDPDPYAVDSTLEDSVRRTVSHAHIDVTARAQESIRRLYPVHTDRLGLRSV